MYGINDFLSLLYRYFSFFFFFSLPLPFLPFHNHQSFKKVYYVFHPNNIEMYTIFSSTTATVLIFALQYFLIGIYFYLQDPLLFHFSHRFPVVSFMFFNDVKQYSTLQELTNLFNIYTSYPIYIHICHLTSGFITQYP